MPGKITDEIIEYVGILAKLELSGDEKKAAKSDMERMLEYVDQLKELPTGEAEPAVHIFEQVNVFREDIVTNGDGHEDALANAPERKGRSFAAPKTFAPQGTGGDA